LSSKSGITYLSKIKVEPNPNRIIEYAFVNLLLHFLRETFASIALIKFSKKSAAPFRNDTPNHPNSINFYYAKNNEAILALGFVSVTLIPCFDTASCINTSSSLLHHPSEIRFLLQYKSPELVAGSVPR